MESKSSAMEWQTFHLPLSFLANSRAAHLLLASATLSCARVSDLFSGASE